MNYLNDKIELTIDSVEYHRNGIGGEGFYAMRLELLDKYEPGTTKTLIVTIEADEDDPDNKLNYRSCRVINPFDVTDKYRGDIIGDLLAANAKDIFNAYSDGGA